MKKLYLLLYVLFLIYWGCEANFITEVTLWGVVYSVENTTELDLYNTQLTGSIPPEIGNLTNLTYLNLGNNQLTGSIPSEIGNLTNLTSLSLMINQLTGSIPPEIGNLTNLEYLLLQSNQLTGKIPKSICDLEINWSDPWYFSTNNNQLCPPYLYCPGDYAVDPNPPNCN